MKPDANIKSFDALRSVHARLSGCVWFQLEGILLFGGHANGANKHLFNTQSLDLQTESGHLNCLTAIKPGSVFFVRMVELYSCYIDLICFSNGRKDNANNNNRNRMQTSISSPQTPPGLPTLVAKDAIENPPQGSNR